MNPPQPEEIERIRRDLQEGRDASELDKCQAARDLRRLIKHLDWQAGRIVELEKTVADLNKEAQMYAQRLTGEVM